MLDTHTQPTEYLVFTLYGITENVSIKSHLWFAQPWGEKRCHTADVLATATLLEWPLT